MADDILHIQYNPDHACTTMNHPWPKACTLRGLLTHCADIRSLPEREDLFALSAYCNLNHADGQDQREKLISLSETAGAALYGDYIIREKRNWADVFYDFDSMCWEMNSNGEKMQDGSSKGPLLLDDFSPVGIASFHRPKAFFDCEFTLFYETSTIIL